MAAEVERQLLNHYKLTTLYPSEWPASLNEDSDGEDGGPSPTSPTRSRFYNLDRQASIRSSVSGTQKTSVGADSLVQKDESDPLGLHTSVAGQLHHKGLPVEDNLKLRNRFMLSSTSFSPQLFLSQVHQNASTQDLLRGLDFLSRSIEQKSASLKVLVESNFERFVRAKAVIDNVYTEMRTQGQDEASAAAAAGRRPHSRHTSRGNASHFRNTSGPFSPNKDRALPSEKRKNALTKESEYGVQGIKAPLLEVMIKAEEVWGPALGGREKEESLKAVLKSIEEHHDIFKLPSGLAENIKKQEYDNIVEQYKRARRAAEEAKSIADAAQRYDKQLTDPEVYLIIATGRMWFSVNEQIEGFKKTVWKRLMTSHVQARYTTPMAEEVDRDTHLNLIGVLLQLGVEESPIWAWLYSRLDHLRDKIAGAFERSRIEAEIMRRRLGNGPATDLPTLAKHLRSASKGAAQQMDRQDILNFWERLQNSLHALLSPQTGILGEMVEFWETAQSFIDGKAQRSLPPAVFAAGGELLELPPENVQQLRKGTTELVTLIREQTYGLFGDPPVEDISALYSPIPPPPITPASASVSTFTPSDKRAFSFKPHDMPPPSPRKGDAWENYAFWPPHGNSLSGSHYLSRILLLVGTAASELTSMSLMRTNPRSNEPLKALLNGIRERTVTILCLSWNADAEKCRVLEDWTRSAERPDITNMPSAFAAFEEKLLSNMQKILYIEAGSGDVVVTPPSAKLLHLVKSQFVGSLYKALSGMVEVAEKTKWDGARQGDPDGLTVPQLRDGAESAGGVAVDAGNRNVRMLLTLSNLNYLRNDPIPQLISQFESSFSVNLTEESKTIRDVLGQIDAHLFQSYVRPTVDNLSAIVHAGINAPGWVPSTARPADARPYVYDVLLTLVLVHTEVSTTAATLTNQLLSYLLEQTSLALILAFKTRPRYNLPALMQATLDVEFMAQTLNNYTTDRAGEVQSQIYLALDERTDNEARARLQGELPEMRSILKRLREGTRGEFACFKRERRGRDKASDRVASR